jgi:ubiquinone/menaquinone biosynthesis C-methylase UbiE
MDLFPQGNPASAPPWYAALLMCTGCHRQGLTVGPDEVRCPGCGASWPVVDGVPMLARTATQKEGDSPKARHSAAIESAVREFYEKNPFPTYDDFDSIGSLVEKAGRGVYAKLLDDQIPVSAKVLECGCGTGQLSTFLSIANRRCLGLDLCMASLRCGRRFREKHDLRSVDFIQGNLFDLPVAPDTFDLVISKGVLHHTPDAHRAFLEVVKRARPGGYVIIGLYNLYGRVPSWLRKQFFRLFGREAFGGDYVMRQVIKSKEKRRIWWEDQYNHPHETWHSVDEVLSWFREAGITYVNAYPRIAFGGPADQAGGEAADRSAPRLFQQEDPGSSFAHVLRQLGWMFTIGREGALFDIIGRRAVD